MEAYCFFESKICIKPKLFILQDDIFLKIRDSYCLLYLQVFSDIEASEQHRLDTQFSGSEKIVEVMRNSELRSIQRTTTRISLTCRLVLKVHKNLFKF